MIHERESEKEIFDIFYMVVTLGTDWKSPSGRLSSAFPLKFLVKGVEKVRKVRIIKIRIFIFPEI